MHLVMGDVQNVLLLHPHHDRKAQCTAISSSSVIEFYFSPHMFFKFINLWGLNSPINKNHKQINLGTTVAANPQ